MLSGTDREGARRDWDDLARLDPLWGILSHPERRHGRWEIDAFFASGEDEIAAALSTAADLGLPRSRATALDVGCGVGRLTRPLAARFTTVVGVDVSSVMVERARDLNADLPNCTFVVADDPDLTGFGDRSVDLVYSALVLQHLPREMMHAYVRGFVRVLADGGVAAFQLPTRMPLRSRLQLGRRAYAWLRDWGVPATVLYRGGLTSIRMGWLPDTAVHELVHAAGGEIVASTPYPRTVPAFGNTTYFAARRPG